jgi:hypothetical protein
VWSIRERSDAFPPDEPQGGASIEKVISDLFAARIELVGDAQYGL